MMIREHLLKLEERRAKDPSDEIFATNSVHSNAKNYAWPVLSLGGEIKFADDEKGQAM